MPANFDFSVIETATLGHFLSSGFMSPAIQCIIPQARIAGPALTVRLPEDDGAALTDALSEVEAGQVIVIDRCGDMRHACWGAVTTHAAMARGAVGAIIDGFITDKAAILALGFPVWCRGCSPMTTRNRRLGGQVGGVVSCGGVQVTSGDIALADENGVAVLARDQAVAHCTTAKEMQDAEPELIRRLHEGQTLAQLTDRRAPPRIRAKPAVSKTTRTNRKT